MDKNAIVKKIMYLICLVVCAGLLTINGSVFAADSVDTTYVSEQGGNADNHWVKNGDTWTYTFDVFDDEIPYYVWEDILSGYTSDAMGQQILFNEDGEKTYTITNYSTDLSALKITKNVRNSSTEQKFDFTIRINDWLGTFVRSGIVFQDGVAHVKLGNGESITIEGLPSDKQYLVEEENVAHFNTAAQNASGILTKSDDGTIKPVEVIFTNNYEPPVINPQDLKLKKEVVGEFDDSGEFDFFIHFENLDANSEYNIVNGESFVSDDSGVSDFEITLAGGQEVIFEKLPAGTVYTISEKEGPYKSSYTIEADKTVSSSKENNSENTALTTEAETIAAGETNTVIFTNEIHKTEDLKIKKVLIDAQPEDENKKFDFRIELFGLEEGSYVNSSIGRLVADDKGYAIKEFSLSAQEEIIINDLPVGVEYKITELSKKNITDNFVSSYVILDANNPSQTIISDASDTKNQDFGCERQRIAQDKDIEVVFGNIRIYNIEISKSVSGNKGDKNQEFHFIAHFSNNWDKYDVVWEKGSNSGKVENSDFEFVLKHGEKITFNNLSKGVSVGIEEIDANQDEYETSATGGNVSVNQSSGVVSVSTVIEQDQEISFENRKEIPMVDFGFTGGAGIGISIALAVLVIGGVWFVLRRRHNLVSATYL